MKLHKSLLLAAAFALPLTLSAEAPKKPVQQEIKKEAVKQESSKELNKEAIAAAYRLFDSMHLKHIYGEIVQSATNGLIQREAKLKKVKTQIENFYKKYIGWSAVKEDLAKVYAKYYKASELDELTKFYKTDLGQKTLKLLPKISIEGRKLGYDKVMSHQNELKKIVDKALKPKVSEAKKEEKKK